MVILSCAEPSEGVSPCRSIEHHRGRRVEAEAAVKIEGSVWKEEGVE